MKGFLYKLFFYFKHDSVNILRSFVSGLGILFLIAFFVMYLAVKSAVLSYISGSLLDNLASDEIKILPKNAKAVEYVKREGSPGISQELYSKIKSMPDFKATSTISRTPFSIRLKGEILGKSRSTFVPVCGVDRNLIKDKVPRWQSFYNKKPVPIIVPKFTIDLMNNYMSSMENLPSLSEKDLIGFPVELKFHAGKRNTPFYKEYFFDGEVHSFTDLLNFPGVIVPTDFLAEVTAQYRRETGGQAALDYAVVYARVKDPDKLPVIVSNLKSMGLKVESQKDIAEKTQKTMGLINEVFFAIMAVFLVVSIISIFNSYLAIVYIRSERFSLQRILGFPKISILSAFILESAAVGAVYGAGGYFIGNYLLSHGGEILSKWVPMLSAVHLETAGADILFCSVLFASAVCVIAAAIPGIFASNINLFKAVRK